MTSSSDPLGNPLAPPQGQQHNDMMVFPVKIMKDSSLNGETDGSIWATTLSLKAAISVFISSLGVTLLSYANDRFSRAGRSPQVTDEAVTGLWLISVSLSVSSAMISGVGIVGFMWGCKIDSGWKDASPWLNHRRGNWIYHLLAIFIRGWFTMLYLMWGGTFSRRADRDGGAGAVPQDNETHVGRLGDLAALSITSDILFLGSPIPLFVGLVIFIWSDASRTVFVITVFMAFLTFVPWLWRLRRAVEVFSNNRSPIINYRVADLSKRCACADQGH